MIFETIGGNYIVEQSYSDGIETEFEVFRQDLPADRSIVGYFITRTDIPEEIEVYHNREEGEFLAIDYVRTIDEAVDMIAASWEIGS